MKILLDLTKNLVPTRFRDYNPHGKYRGERGAHFDDIRENKHTGASTSILIKRKPWVGNLKEKIIVDKSHGVMIGRKKVYSHTISIGDMKVTAIPSYENNKLNYILWEEHEVGSSTLGGGKFGKFIRLRVIAESQKMEKTISTLDDKIHKLRGALKQSDTYTKCRKFIEIDAQMIERRKESLLDKDLPDNMRQVYEEDIKNRMDNINNYYDELNKEGSEYTLMLNEIKLLCEKREDISNKLKSEIYNKIFQYLPQGQKRPIKLDQKEWASGPPLASSEQIEHFRSLVTPYSSKGSDPLKLTLVVDPNINRRSCHDFHDGSDPESYIYLYNGQHIFDYISIHEFGHALEAQSYTISKNCHDFLQYRTDGEDLRPLSEVSDTYGNDEMYKKDEFVDAYCGKIYPRGGVTELMSMGLQKLYEDPVKFAKEDTEYFDLVICNLYDERWYPDENY
jgi:hypothetical protein